LKTLGISAANINPKLNTNLICPGFIYGYGEDVFYEFFKNGWLKDPAYLPLLVGGNNSIPTIHIYDLVSLVKRIIQNNPKQWFIFAVDRTKNKSLRGIVESISKSTGTGQIQNFTENNF
jgi:adenylate kinase